MCVTSKNLPNIQSVISEELFEVLQLLVT